MLKFPGIGGRFFYFVVTLNEHLWLLRGRSQLVVEVSASIVLNFRGGEACESGHPGNRQVMVRGFMTRN